jgi:mevalonate kinase
VAAARAIAAFCGRELSPAETSALAFEAEKIYHGSPSGIDNTVIAYEQPVWFRRAFGSRVTAGNAVAANTEHRAQNTDPRARSSELGTSSEAILIPHLQSPTLVIADTGIVTPTRVPVGDVRRGWETEPARYERLFDQIAEVVTASRDALQCSDWVRLGALMNANHALLQALGVSIPELDHLCDAARTARALGAKMSGGGRGGNMIALASDADHTTHLRLILRQAGAARVL